MVARPQRENRRQRQSKRPDPILAREANKLERRCDVAAAAYYQARDDMDRKWGHDRLPGYAPPAMADKFAIAETHLHDMEDAKDPERIRDAAQNCIRGLQAMDAAADQAKKPRAMPQVVEMSVDGQDFAILLDQDYWLAARDQYPDIQFVTPREIKIALEYRQSDYFAKIEKHFPDSKVAELRPHGSTQITTDDLEDEIPF